MAVFLTYEDMIANIGGYTAEHTVLYDSSNEFRAVQYFYRNRELAILWKETSDGRIALTSTFMNVADNQAISFLDANDKPSFFVRKNGDSLAIGKYDQEGQFIDEIRID